MSALLVAQAAHRVSDTLYFWVEVAMVVTILVALIVAHLLGRSNKRLREGTQERLEQARGEATAADANADALAGRPGLPETAAGKRDANP